MAQWDATDLLARCRREARVPTTTEFPATADWYAWLTEAENRVKTDLAPVCPEALIGAPTAMITTDGGYTYTFAADADTNSITPIGHVGIFRNKADIPFYPLTAGVHFEMEGWRIRGVQNRPVPPSSDGGLWARYITPTLKIDGSTAPTILPVQMRQLLVDDAVKRFYKAGGLRDWTPAEDDYQTHLTNWITTLQTQFRGTGAIDATRRPRSRSFGGRYGRRY
jgi:hypothetical protein